MDNLHNHNMSESFFCHNNVNTNFGSGNIRQSLIDRLYDTRPIPKNEDGELSFHILLLANHIEGEHSFDREFLSAGELSLLRKLALVMNLCEEYEISLRDFVQGAAKYTAQRREVSLLELLMVNHIADERNFERETLRPDELRFMVLLGALMHICDDYGVSLKELVSSFVEAMDEVQDMPGRRSEEESILGHLLLGKSPLEVEDLDFSLQDLLLASRIEDEHAYDDEHLSLGELRLLRQLGLIAQICELYEISFPELVLGVLDYIEQALDEIEQPKVA